jgi:hypothetical protein
MRHLRDISKSPVTAVSGLQLLLDAILNILDIAREAILANPWKIWTPGGGTGT